MKKFTFLYLLAIAGLAFMQTGCNNGEQKTATTKASAPALQDSLKIFLEAKKMEVKAFNMLQPGYYDSSLAHYNQCLTYMNKALADNHNKGFTLLSQEFIEVNQGMGAIYDSIHQPENSVKCALECLKWARLTHDYQQQIKFDMNAADKLKNLAAGIKDDTTKRGSAFREAEQYAMAGNKVIDSLKTNDMEDLRYEDYQLTSKIFALAGDKKQAQAYDKKYRDTYFKIYQKQP